MKKVPILWCKFLHKYYDLKKISPLHLAPFQKNSGIVKKNTNVDRETCTTVLSVSFWFGSNPKEYLYLYRDIIFSFILVYTQLIWRINYYRIIFDTKKYNLTRCLSSNFNWPFIVFNKNIIFIHFSLNSQ